MEQWNRVKTPPETKVSHKECHNLGTDLHVFGSYVTVHLPHVHPLVVDTTHDDRVLEGIWIDNDLHTPNFLSVDLQA